MPLTHLEHFLVQSTDIEKTKNWYVDVLGMREGAHPDFGFPVHWLYLGDVPVLHLTQGGADVTEDRLRYLGQQSQASEGTGVIDHIAFRATGLATMIAHFKKLGVAFKERQVDDQGLYQLFLFDPNGIKVELNFEATEAKGRRAEVMATDYR
ncbi:MAG: VOC family protein [Alphaproteobacteria bacterium]|nr:VOC family protein [Alphaproteobacteria bacterium]